MVAGITIYPLRFTPMLLHFLSYIGRPGNTLQSADIECGKPLMGTSRIIGGEEAFAGEFPWMVSIHYKNQHFCGGALISRRWVLTASHCFYRLRNNTKSLTVVVGSTYQNTSSKTASSENYAVNKVIIHPEFKVYNYINDVALLQLNRPVVWSRFQLPVCLPDDEDDLYAGNEAVVTGWGWTSENSKGGHKPTTLQKLSVKVIDNRMCTMWYREANYPLTVQPVQLCAGYKEGGRDSCEGDSGGPLVIKEGDRYVIIGIVSSGVGCARPFLPGLYSRVSLFVPWIKTQVRL